VLALASSDDMVLNSAYIDILQLYTQFYIDSYYSHKTSVSCACPRGELAWWFCGYTIHCFTGCLWKCVFKSHL